MPRTKQQPASKPHQNDSEVTQNASNAIISTQPQSVPLTPVPPLTNRKYDAFVRYVVSGLSLGDAYIKSGFAKGGAHNNASRLMGRPDVSARYLYLTQLASQRSVNTLTALSIRAKADRIDAHQRDTNRIDALLDARSKGESGIETGLVIRKLRAIGSGANQQIVEEYEFDKSVLEERRAQSRQAAEELGQFATKISLESNTSEATELAALMTTEELQQLRETLMVRRNAQGSIPAQVQPASEALELAAVE